MNRISLYIRTLFLISIFSIASVAVLHAEQDNGRDPYAAPDPFLQEEFELEADYRAEAKEDSRIAEFGGEEEEDFEEEEAPSSSARSSRRRDQKIQDDLVVMGSGCFGLDCVNGESFGFDTLRLKENNLRIKFVDTSSSSSFPTRDWEITINDSVNGGANKFSIQDIDSSTTPFTILGSAPNNSLYVASNGNIGLGTSTPLVDISVKQGNTPTLRLEQDTSSGFAEQTWDVAGNETNFFVRDVTNGSKLPFRIQPNAPNASLFIASDGDVGFETTTPDGQFDIAHSADANNHAFFVSPVSYVGVNIDNGFLPNGLFEVQTTGGVSRFLVEPSGNVGIGTSTPAGVFHVENTAGDDVDDVVIDSNGQIGIGTSSPAGVYHVENTAGDDIDDFVITSDGDIGIGTTAPSAPLHILKSDHDNTSPLLIIENNDSAPNNQTMLRLLNNQGSISLELENALSAVTWKMTNDGDVFSLSMVGSGATEFRVDQSGNLTTSGTVNGTSSKTVKKSIKPVNEIEILDRISRLQVSTWQYKSENGITHLGPMAEDFSDLFGLGSDNKHIAASDMAGVAIASVKSLNKQLQDKNREIEHLKSQNAAISERLKKIEILVQSLL